MNSEPYRHSGHAPPGGLALAMIATIIGSLVLGVAYAFAVSWIPIVQASVLATGALGAAIGGIAGFSARLGKIRNGAIIPLFAVIGGLLALWMAWVFDAKARFGISEAPLLLNPTWLLGYMQDFHAEGFWSMGRNDTTVSGTPLLIIWAIEAGVIVVLSFAVARMNVGALPFCESCDQWTKKTEAFCQFLIPSEDATTLQLVRDGDLSSLNGLETCVGNHDGSLRLDLFRCSACEDSSYATINTVTMTTNKKGEVNTKVEPIVTHGHLSPEEMQMLQGIREGATDEPSDVS